MSRLYQFFGLIVESDLVLPEAIEVPSDLVPDVVFRLAKLSDGLTFEPGVHRLGPTDHLLCISETARYRCVGGNEIVVEPVFGAPERNVRLFLLGSAAGLLLHQRGLLPLHANAVEIGGRAFCFAGSSGAGKSTLAAWFSDHGFPILADDVSVIEEVQGEGGAVVHAGLARLRLWREALEQLNRRVEDFERSHLGDDDWEKYDVPVTRAADLSMPLGAVVLLERGQEERIIRLQGLAAVETLMVHTYRGGFIEPGQLPHHLEACVKVARCVPVLRWERVWGHEHLAEGAKSVIKAIVERA